MPATRVSGRASSARSGRAPRPAACERAPAPRRDRHDGPAAPKPSLDQFRALARDHTVVPVWREVLADLETPVSAYRKIVGAGEGFLLESVEHAERWGRFSFIGRDPVVTLIARGDQVQVVGEVPDGIPTDAGALAAIEALLARHRAPRLEELPPFHGGVVGYLGYDVVREVERLPNVPADPVGWPDAVVTLTGHVTAFDHFRQRLFLIENVFVTPAMDATRARRRLRARRDPARRVGGRARAAAAVHARSRHRRPRSRRCPSTPGR